MTTRSEKRVIPLELFFDLVLVFALTQGTALMSDDPTWQGLGRGMLVLAALWWAWGAYAWLTNEIDADEDLPRLAMFTSMAAMLIAALAVPSAFGDDGVIIALGESIVAIGIGAADLGLEIGLLAAAALGVVIACALWWAYFDWTAIHAERVFRETEGDERARMARDAFSYLHLPMVAGIILVALGIKKTLEHVDAPLEAVPTVALLGGIALYLAGHLGFRLRLHSGLGRGRLIAAAVSLALIPLALEVDALGAVAIAAAVSSALIAYEVIGFAEERARVRTGAGPG